MSEICHVLLIEDDEVDRMAFRRAAARWEGPRLTLTEAATGDEGLTLAHTEAVDCILLDFHLPDMDGIEFLDRLAALVHPGASLPPVMMLTGADSATVAAESIRRGARDYVVKDSEGQYLARLPDAIARMLREQRLLEEKRGVETALRQSQDELRRLSTHQERIKEKERKRIAQEVHDELGGLLTGIKAYLSVAIQNAANQGTVADPLLGEAAALAQTAIETVRRVITELRPSVLDQLGVWAALEWYTEQVQLRTGLRCQCSIDPDVAVMSPGPECSTMLFRVTQEALTNVARHAEASAVQVTVQREGDGLSLEVRDDGKGIDTAGMLDRESWGILGMHERSRQFGGVLTLEGQPGQGTCLRLRLPQVEDNEY
jgi:signal transduction histidine kinase